MPFTAAHPAIVLPFLKIDKRYLSATGLVVGSITPDFEYFINMSAKGHHTHSLAGLFYIDIPLGILIAILFHRVVKKNLIANLPVFLQRRLSGLRDFDFTQYLKQRPWALVLAVALGAASHLLWDSFTHHDGYFVTRLPFYSNVVPFDGVKYPLFYALQNISTVVGLLAVGAYIIFIKADPTVAVSNPGFIYWIAIWLVTSVILFARFGLDLKALNFGNFVVSTISAICCSLLLAGRIRFNQATVKAL